MASGSDSPTPLLRPALLADGLNDAGIRAQHRQADWARIRPGAYLNRAHWDGLDQHERHRLLVAATVPKLDPSSVISHTSAAVLHGLPLLESPPHLVHVIRDQPTGGYRRGRIHSHVGCLDPAMRTLVGDVAVTSVARTVIDCACLLSFPSAVCLADDALHRRLTSRDELASMLQAVGRR